MARRPFDQHITRQSLEHLQEAAEAFRVVVVHGPRQSGKSTALRDLQRRTGGRLFDLDDASLRTAALTDPESLIDSGEPYVFIHEFQRGGNDLVLAVKRMVDDPLRTTHFVLAGSTNLSSLHPTCPSPWPGIRAVLQEIWPFSQGELAGVRDRFLTLLTTDPDAVRDAAPEKLSREEYLTRIVEGGYPEPLRLYVGPLAGIMVRQLRADSDPARSGRDASQVAVRPTSGAGQLHLAGLNRPGTGPHHDQRCTGGSTGAPSPAISRCSRQSS